MTTTRTKKMVRAVQAAEILECSAPTLLALTRRDVFTVKYPNGPGVGRRCWYHPDELELFKETRDEDTVRAFRKKHKRI